MTIGEARFVVLDTETTGIDHQKDCVLEIAARLWNPSVVDFGAGLFETLVQPARPIPAEASGVHHLVDADFRTAPTFAQVLPDLEHFVGDGIAVGHCIDFDLGFLPSLRDRRKLCTERLARHLWPMAPNFKNATLFYWRKCRPRPQGSHRAGADVLMTSAVFWELLYAYAAHLEQPADEGFRSLDVDALLAFAASPIFVEVMPFGKHRGTPTRELPPDYIEWALRNMVELDADLKGTFTTILAERRKKRPSVVGAAL